MTDSTLYNALLILVFAMAPITYWSLTRMTAPYGRHNAGGKGPEMDTKLAWVVMECPSVFAFAYFFLTGPEPFKIAPLILFAIWQVHYVQRTFIYTLQMKTSPDKKTPVMIVAQGFLFNMINSYLNGSWIAGVGRSYEASWLADPRFLVGAALFATGYWINRRADAILRELRRPGETGYKIPRGWLYERITCPNYFGEILEWTGWAIATWSLAGLSFAVFTAANLIPRAFANHRWYKEKFPDYPAERKIVIPFVV